MDGKKRGRKNSQDPQFKHLDIGTANAASAGDFTGLIPAAPRQAGAMDAYEDVYDFGNDLPEDIEEMEKPYE